MRILGINYLSESSVALLENGKIKYALSEERINRKKTGGEILIRLLIFY